MLPVMGAVARVGVLRVRDGHGTRVPDAVVVEAPLEVRVNGAVFATIMRTPGQDRELAAGFLLAERVLRDPDDLGTIAHCRDGDAADVENVINVGLIGSSADAAVAALEGRRVVVAASSCGVCGRRSIDDLAASCVPVMPPRAITPEVIEALPEQLRACQSVFTETGGLHGAGLFTADGALLASAEDVGRHNAVDKVVGGLVLRDALPASGAVLCVSGRTSFEIVQKAWVAGIPCLVSVSAPSSLAVDLARTAGITLVGFVRDRGFNVYTGETAAGAAVEQ